MPSSMRMRPSTYVVLCAVLVITVFVVRGDLRINGDGDTRLEEAARGDRPSVIKNHLPAPNRENSSVALSGRVFDALGYALAGAEVLGPAGEVARTDDRGSFELSVAETAFLDVLIRARGCSTSVQRASAVAPGPFVAQLQPRTPWDRRVEHRAAQAALTGEGFVRDVDGGPVAGAYVTAAGSGFWSRTDEIGRYTLPLLDASPTLVVHRPADADVEAVAARSESLDLGRERGVVPLPELMATPGATISGSLRDGEGSPLIGVPVTVEGQGMTHVCESGSSGRFRVTGLVAGSYEVRPMAWRGALGRPREVELDGPVTECEFVFELAQKTRVQIQSEAGVPVGNAYVSVLVAGARHSMAQANESGWVEVDVISGPMEFEVRAEDGARALPVRRLESEQARIVVVAP